MFWFFDRMAVLQRHVAGGSRAHLLTQIESGRSAVFGCLRAVVFCCAAKGGRQGQARHETRVRKSRQGACPPVRCIHTHTHMYARSHPHAAPTDQRRVARATRRDTEYLQQLLGWPYVARTYVCRATGRTGQNWVSFIM